MVWKSALVSEFAAPPRCICAALDAFPEPPWLGHPLRGDIMGAEDRLAKYPYIRESRRIRAEFTVLEQHVGAGARKQAAAEVFPDSVGVGSYRIDLHPSSGGDNYIDIGESAGALAAYAIEKRATPRAVRNTEKLRAEFQARLQAQGVESAWPRLTPR